MRPSEMGVVNTHLQWRKFDADRLKFNIHDEVAKYAILSDVAELKNCMYVSSLIIK